MDKQRFIDAKRTSRLIKEYRDEYPHRTSHQKVCNVILSMLGDEEQIPTANVVEVVRCKDCAVPHNKFTGCPKLNGLIPPPDFYCSYGERRNKNV